MKKIINKKHRGILLLLVLFFSSTLFGADNFVINENVILEKTVVKIEQMANELYQKTGIKAYLVAKKSLDGKNIIEFEKDFSRKIKPPFVILTLSLDDKKVDIYSSKNIEDLFDKESILSPYPWEGSIIPLLTGKKKNVSVSAALLNGYADLVEQISNSKNIKLDSAIGSTNKELISFLNISIFGFLLMVFGWYFYRRMKNR